MPLQSGQIKSKRPELASDQAIVFRREHRLSAENPQVLTVGRAAAVADFQCPIAQVAVVR